MEFSGFICALLLLTALVTDIGWRKIPNLLTMPVALAGLLFHGIGTGGIIFPLAGLLAGCALLFIPFVLGGTGGGDVKLLGAAGAWLGPQAIFSVFVYGAIIGGVISCFMLVRHGGWHRLKALRHDLICFLLTGQAPVPDGNSPGLPYSVPIATGFCLFLMTGNIGI